MLAGAKKLLDRSEEAKIIAMRLGSPPVGYGKWTLRLLARKVVELKIAETISYETIRQTLKKSHEYQAGHRVLGHPPEANAEFVAHMENVLATYEKAYDPTQPVVCMDEQPVQLINETRQPIPETTDHPKRIDYEYQRNGTASIFMFCEPLGEWRHATARKHRTKMLTNH